MLLRPDGTYQIQGLTPGPYRLQVREVNGRNFIPQSYDAHVTGTETSFDIELPKGRIEGIMIGGASADPSQ